MIEKYPLDRVAEAYEQMHSGKVRFRVVLTMVVNSLARRSGHTHNMHDLIIIGAGPGGIALQLRPLPLA